MTPVETDEPEVETSEHDGDEPEQPAPQGPSDCRVEVTAE